MPQRAAMDRRHIVNEARDLGRHHSYMNTIWTDLLGSTIRYAGTKYRTRVIECGDGEPLVLLHGGGGHAEAFSRNVVRLGRNFRAMAIDMVWHGLSSKPPFHGETIAVYAGQVIDLLDTLGIAKAHVEGEAIGGRVALWLAIHRPDRVLKLILNNTGGVSFKEGSVKAQPESRGRYQTAASAAVENPTRETVRQRLERLMVTPDRVTDELVEIRYRFYSDSETNKAQLNIRSTNDPEFTEDEVSQILASGIDQPYGVAQAPDGSVVVVEQGAGRLLSVRDGSVSVLASGLYGYGDHRWKAMLVDQIVEHRENGGVEQTTIPNDE